MCFSEGSSWDFGFSQGYGLVLVEYVGFYWSLGLV